MENSGENGGYPELSSISALSETAALLLSTKQRPDSSSVVNAAALLAPFIKTTIGEGGEGHTEESVSRKMSSNGGSGLSASVRQGHGLRVYALSMDALELVKKKDAALADELSDSLIFEKDVLLVDTPPIDKAVHMAENTIVRQQLEVAKELESYLLHRPPWLAPLTVGIANPLPQLPHQRYGMYRLQTPEDSRLPIGWLTPGLKGGDEISQSPHNGYACRDMLAGLKNEEAIGDVLDEEEATQRAAIALALVKHSPVGGKGGFGFVKKVQKKKRKYQPTYRRKNAT